MENCEHKPLCMTREQTDAMRLELSDTQLENFHLRDELSESRAQVARLREALLFYSNGEHWDWHAGGSNQRILLDVGTKAANALSSLTDQSARDAAVLRAAGEWEPISTELKKYMSATEIPDDGNFLELVEKLDKAETELRQAVRGALSK